MRSLMSGCVAAGAAAVYLAGLCGPALAGSTSAPPQWQTENLTSAVPSGDTSLTAGSAVSAKDAWAVGSVGQSNGDYSTFQPLILQWNGKVWSSVTSTGIPDSALYGTTLSGVAASASAVWVSAQAPTGSSTVPFGIYRLSGSSWVSEPTPAGLSYSKVISGPDGQVWAIGNTANALARWTGTAWRVYRTGLKAPVGTSGITGLGFEGSKDGWAVGYAGKLPLVLRWNGTTWGKAPAPALPKGYSDGGLASVLVTSSAGVWAAGSYKVDTANGGWHYDNWLVRWNGSSWANVTLPAGVATTNITGPTTVSISASKSGAPQWFSGQVNDGASAYAYYSGSKWRPAPGAPVPPDQDTFTVAQLVGVPGTSATWAIGNSVWSGATIEYAP
jgi:hypothetical protein